MLRRCLRRRTRVAGLVGVRGLQRIRLETRGLGIIVGTILVEAEKMTAVYEAVYPTP